MVRRIREYEGASLRGHPQPEGERTVEEIIGADKQFES